MLLIVVIVALFCILLYKFAVYALPAAAGIAVGHWAVMTGAGTAGAIFAGALTGAAVFFIGRRAFSASQNSLTRALIAAVYVIPAFWVGYSTVFQLAETTGTTSPVWQHALAFAAAGMIGYVTYTRLAALPRGMNNYG